MTAEEFVAAARAEVGTTENPPGSNRTFYAAEAGHANGYAWCLTFVVALLKRLGVKVSDGVMATAYTPAAAYAFEHDGRWIKPEDIEPGDVVFFDFPDSKDRIQHVGIATQSVRRFLLVGRRVVTCVEGNTSPGRAGSQDNGGGVYERTRPLAHVVGAGRPYFTNDTEDDEDMALSDDDIKRLCDRLMADEYLGPVKHQIVHTKGRLAEVTRLVRKLAAK